MDENIMNELTKIKKQIKDFEEKYLFTNNMLLITAILNKLDVDNLVITFKELEKFKYKNYVANFDSDSKTVTIRKYEINE